MNKKDVMELINILNENNLESIKYKDQKFELEIHKAKSEIVESVKQNIISEEKVITNTFNSPLVGVFYSKPAPDKASFVEEGATYHAGDTLCIIEAMKVMNEIKASKTMTIKKILVSDEEAIGFDQPLFELA